MTAEHPGLLRPAPEHERINIRGCCNCTHYSERSSECRHDPRPVPVQRDSHCSKWRWFIQSRVCWDSAFAPAEFVHPQQIHKNSRRPNENSLSPPDGGSVSNSNSQHIQFLADARQKLLHFPAKISGARQAVASAEDALEVAKQGLADHEAAIADEVLADASLTNEAKRKAAAESLRRQNEGYIAAKAALKLAERALDAARREMDTYRDQRRAIEISVAATIEALASSRPHDPLQIKEAHHQ